MRYLLMISAEETEDDSTDALTGTTLDTPDPTGEPERRRAEGIVAFTAWLDDLTARGVLRAHEGLWPSRTATPCACAGTRSCSPTGPTSRPRNRSGASPSSRSRPSTRPSRWPPAPPPAPGA